MRSNATPPRRHTASPQLGSRRPVRFAQRSTASRRMVQTIATWVIVIGGFSIASPASTRTIREQPDPHSADTAEPNGPIDRAERRAWATDLATRQLGALGQFFDIHRYDGEDTRATQTQGEALPGYSVAQLRRDMSELLVGARAQQERMRPSNTLVRRGEHLAQFDRTVLPVLFSFGDTSLVLNRAGQLGTVRRHIVPEGVNLGGIGCSFVGLTESSLLQGILFVDRDAPNVRRWGFEPARVATAIRNAAGHLRSTPKGAYPRLRSVHVLEERIVTSKTAAPKSSVSAYRMLRAHSPAAAAAQPVQLRSR